MKVIWLFLLGVVYGQEFQLADTSHQRLLRQKRTLVYKTGSNWVSVIFGIGVPVNVQAQSITLGAVMKAFYLLPDNSTYYTNPEGYIDLDTTRKKRSPSRWHIYELIQQYLERNNYPDGKACLLKSICEISNVPLEQKSGLIAEIFHSILTPSSTDDQIENAVHNEYHEAEKVGRSINSCSLVFPECPDGPVQQFSRFITDQ